jgi:hypothetical protein
MDDPLTAKVFQGKAERNEMSEVRSAFCDAVVKCFNTTALPLKHQVSDKPYSRVTTEISEPMKKNVVQTQ